VNRTTFLEFPKFTGHKGEDPNLLKELAECLAGQIPGLEGKLGVSSGYRAL
jgi:hypothetical protein